MQDQNSFSTSTSWLSISINLWYYSTKASTSGEKRYNKSINQLRSSHV